MDFRIERFDEASDLIQGFDSTISEAIHGVRLFQNRLWSSTISEASDLIQGEKLDAPPLIVCNQGLRNQKPKMMKASFDRRL